MKCELLAAVGHIQRFEHKPFCGWIGISLDKFGRKKRGQEMGPRKHLLEKGKKKFVFIFNLKKKFQKKNTIKANHWCGKEQFKWI